MARIFSKERAEGDSVRKAVWDWALQHLHGLSFAGYLKKEWDALPIELSSDRKRWATEYVTYLGLEPSAQVEVQSEFMRHPTGLVTSAQPIPLKDHSEVIAGSLPQIEQKTIGELAFDMCDPPPLAIVNALSMSSSGQCAPTPLRRFVSLLDWEPYGLLTLFSTAFYLMRTELAVLLQWRKCLRYSLPLHPMVSTIGASCQPRELSTPLM